MGLKRKVSLPASRKAVSLSFAERPQIRPVTPLARSSATVSVPRSCFSTLAMYMSQNIRSKSSSSASRIAVSPLAASRMVHSGATVLMVREKSFRRTRSSSTNKTLRVLGSSSSTDRSCSAFVSFGSPAEPDPSVFPNGRPLASSHRSLLVVVVPSVLSPPFSPPKVTRTPASHSSSSSGNPITGASMGPDWRSMTNRAPGCPGTPLS
mmetsp:Transcript_447/g.907  ORF Transcript_447/g.907 Transcript_447/m.907 type:complete len:208 (-) Transcript_447:823-1446(-)